MTWRYRLARWLVGPFFRLTETGSWMVTHDAEHQTTIGIRVAEWHGELRTDLAPFDVDADGLVWRPGSFREHTMTGEFSGRFIA